MEWYLYNVTTNRLLCGWVYIYIMYILYTGTIQAQGSGHVPGLGVLVVACGDHTSVTAQEKRLQPDLGLS